MSQHARAAIPVPHNQYGHAADHLGIKYADGEFVSSWIDGVMYGWNMTFTDLADLDPANQTSKIDIDTAGNQVTIPGDPDTPWIKEGGDHGVDDIMYVLGDMTDPFITMDGQTSIFEQTDVWETFDFFYSDLTIAPIQPPALPKINNIVTLPGDSGTQYIYIYGPQGTPMDEFYLEKNDGVLHNVATQIPLSGTISETTYFYVDLGATDYLNPLGDELKLVWSNPGGPGTPFGGMDVVVDRVEFNATAGGTHYGEPDNTIMPDAIPASFGFGISRQPLPGWDTNDCSADFIQGVEPGRPPGPPYELSVSTGVGTATGGGQTIHHITNRVDPVLGWTQNTTIQYGYQLEVADDPVFTTLRWTDYQVASNANNAVYGGPYLTEGTCFYYRVRMKNAMDYGAWADTTICMNSPPPVPTNIYPANETVDPSNVNITWAAVIDAEGDSVNYELQVDDDPLFGSPITPIYFGPDPFQERGYGALTTYYYRVRAHDGYEYSAWSSEGAYWWFNTTNPPLEPEAIDLTVEGFLLPTPETNHLTNRVNPEFGWTFTDGNAGDSQQAYNMEIRDAPGGLGNLIWASSGGASQLVTYIGPQLSECMDYWFRVEVQDDSASQLWSLAWTEGMFHSNCIPTVPVLVNPADQSAQTENSAQTVVWLASTDNDVLDSITYEWVVDQDCPATMPYIASGSTAATVSDSFDTTGMAGTYFNWTVRAGDSWEWSAEATCFMFYIPIPNQAPGPALNLAVDGFTAAPEITHLLNPTPTFSWTFNDPDVGDTQGDIDVIVSTGPGGTGTVIWDPAPQAYTMESIVYGGGMNPQPCETYYFGILTADDKHLWADVANWAEIMFAMNCPPTVPVHDTPADAAVLTPSATQTVSWLASTDPGDTLMYTVQVADNSGMTPPYILEETISGLTSSAFDTTGLGCFWWRVNATDGYESSAWSTPWSFCVNNAPGMPTNLTVEGETAAPNITHILVAEPTFTWVFVDPDAGDTQEAYEVEVWDGAGGTGTMMWSYSGTTAMTVDYNADSMATALVPGTAYYFRVRGSDAYEFGPWAEIMFELNGPPPAPTLTTPANLATDVAVLPALTWASGGADPNGDTVTYYWFVDTDATPTQPYTENNSTSATTVTMTVTLTGLTTYYWYVCADDGLEQACSAVWSFETLATNAPPTANAGSDQSVEEGDTVTLTGTGTDSDGTIALYEWDFTNDGTYDFSSATSGTTTHIYAVAGTYTATLRVTDDDGATATDSAVITVAVAPEEEEDNFLANYWWIILIIIIIVILLLILLMRRKKPEEEEEAPVEEEAPAEEEPEEAPAEEEAEEAGEMKECPNCGTVLAADDTECFMCGATV